ncbi:MAG: hypothetical protein FWG28_08680, partial [Clostridiales bacterium]|nr:hypothetical protein [Clostridiales bacterium]
MKKNKKGTKRMAALLTLAMLLSLLPAAALPASAEAAGGETTVAVFVQEDENGFMVADTAFAVAADTAEQYGYTDDFDGAKVSVLDVLVAVHVAMYGDDEAAIHEALALSGDNVSRAFSEYDASVFTFLVNGAFPMEDGLGLEIVRAEVKDGDTVTFLLRDDEYGFGGLMNQLAWFEMDGSPIKSVEVEAGESLTLALQGLIMYYLFESEGVQDMMTAPIEDAYIYTLDVTDNGSWHSARLGQYLAATDEDGEFAISFDEPGTYYVTASDGDSWETLALPWLEVTVTESSGDGGGGDYGDSETVTVYIDFEGYNLGQGFYIEPIALTLPAGSSAADATVALLTQEGYGFEAIGGGDSFYLSYVLDFDKGEIAPPSYITVPLGEGKGNGALGEFDYYYTAGWMITVNHVIIGSSAGGFILEDGDVIRWQFSVVGLGADLGIAAGIGEGEEPLYVHEDKGSLIRALFLPGVSNEAKAAALAVLIDPLAGKTVILEAIQALEDSVDVTPTDPPGPSEDAWFIVDSPAGSIFTVAAGLMDQVREILERDYGQSAGSYDYSVVKRLKITGSAASGYLFNMPETRETIRPYLVELDMSEMSSIGGNEMPNIGSSNAGEQYPALERVVLPPTITSTGLSSFRGSSALKSVTFSSRADGSSVTSVGSSSTSLFSGCTSLEELIFKGKDAPSIISYAFSGSNNATAGARVVTAYVPDPTSGGYQNSAFAQYFKEVLPIGAAPVKTIGELEDIVSRARVRFTDGLDYTDASWSAFADAFAAAESVLAAFAPTSS